MARIRLVAGVLLCLVGIGVNYNVITTIDLGAGDIAYIVPTSAIGIIIALIGVIVALAPSNSK